MTSPERGDFLGKSRVAEGCKVNLQGEPKKPQAKGLNYISGSHMPAHIDQCWLTLTLSPVSKKRAKVKF